MVYVTPADMEVLYEQEQLVLATNYSDPQATTINTSMLTAACEHGSRLVDGYLLSVKVSPSKFSDRFLGILKIHAARLAMDYFQGTSGEDERGQVKESIEWLKSLSKLSQADLQNLATGEPDVEVEPIILPAVSFCEGRRWNITF